MSESFVDLTYRGLAFGKRVKLTQVRPSTGFVELAAPMPVGTSITLTNEDGLAFEAFVQESIEQVTGREGVAPGMTLRPRLEGAIAAWWKARVALPDVVKPEAAPVIGIVRSKRSSNAGVPELVDDGRNTAVQDAVDPAKLGEAEPEKDTQVIPVMDAAIVDDGRATTAMDAVDLAALGLDISQSGQMPVVKGDEASDNNEGLRPSNNNEGLRPSNNNEGLRPSNLDDDDGDVKSGPAGNKKKKRRR